MDGTGEAERSWRRVVASLCVATLCTALLGCLGRSGFEGLHDSRDGAALRFTTDAATMNPNSFRQLTTNGGEPPVLFQIETSDDSSSQAAVDLETGLFRSGPRESTVVLRAEDTHGQTARTTIRVSPEQVHVIGGVEVPALVTYDAVYSSVDGLAWRLAGSLPLVREDGAAAVFDDRIWYVGGFDGAAAHGDVFSSDDGSAWLSTGVIPEPRVSGAMVIFDGELVVLGGTTEDGNAALARDEIFASSDGQSWRLLGRLPLAQTAFAAMVYGGRIWVLGGQDTGGASLTDVISSADGVTWTHEGDLPAPRFGFALAELNGALWIFGGRNSSTLHNVLTSVDGMTWSASGSWPNGLYAGAHATLQGRLLWIGGSTAPASSDTTADIYSSTDGVAWSQSAGAFPRPVGWSVAVAFTPP